MSTSLKKLLLISITLLLGVMSGGVVASPAPSVSFVSGNEYAYDNGSSTTHYFLSFTAMNYFSDSTPFNTANMAWWGDSSAASLFANAVGASLGPVPDGNFGYNPGFAYSGNSTTLNMFDSQGSGGASSLSVGPPTYNIWTVATSSLTAGAPEIDGSLAPKVGFLLGCLFLLFGRKKQNAELMLTA